MRSWRRRSDIAVAGDNGSVAPDLQWFAERFVRPRDFVPGQLLDGPADDASGLPNRVATVWSTG